MAKVIIIILLSFTHCYALLLDDHFSDNLARRYGKEIVRNYSINPETKAEAKLLMNEIEEQNAEQIEKRLFAAILKDKTAPRDLLTRCQGLQNPRARCTFAFELLKCLTLSKEIPSFAKSSYRKEQLQFLKEMITILERDQNASPEEYPRDAHNSAMQYIYEGNQPKALFKPSNYERDNEVVFWEISFLLGFEKISVPVTPAILQNSLGLLHRFVQNDVPGDKVNHPNLFSWILRDSYLLASIAILTLSLKDIHNWNMAYTLSTDGYFSLRLFDTTQAFKKDYYYCDVKEGYRRLHAPFTWAGWDYPQASMPLTKNEQKTMTALFNSWSEEDIAAYLKHPMTNFILTEEESYKFFERMKILKECKSSSPQDWLIRFAPMYPAVKQKLKFFFPEHGPNGVIFYFVWNPPLLRSWVAPEKQAAFEEWLTSFST